MEINKYIEHTNLKAYATEEDIRKLCQEAIDYGFQAVVVNPHYVPFVKDLLNGTNIEIGTVVGFPLGANTIETKVYETIDAIEKGATEIDMVANIGAIKDGDFEYVKKEIEATLAAKKSEQMIMSLMPAGIILYLQLASPGFLDILYGNPFGICAMTVCLAVYGAAYWMGKRIVEIEV